LPHKVIHLIAKINPLSLFKQIFVVLSDDQINALCARCAELIKLTQVTLTLRVEKSRSLQWVWYLYWER